MLVHNSYIYKTLETTNKNNTMTKEELLTLKELRQCVFENRNNKITLYGIKDYFKRNQDHYDLRATF